MHDGLDAGAGDTREASVAGERREGGKGEGAGQ